jgi:hypothetical protein
MKQDAGFENLVSGVFVATNRHNENAMEKHTKPLPEGYKRQGGQ